MSRTSLLRFVADRIDEGFPAPDSIDTLRAASLPVSVTFYDRGDDHEPWLDEFGCDRRVADEKSIRGGTTELTSWLGILDDVEVRVLAFRTVEAHGGAV